MTRVLLVDDVPENLDYLRVLLTAHDFSVETASQGAEALALAQNTVPDLVISDLLMPVMDGYTLLRLWKSDERLSKVPFIVYTATYTDPEDERLALTLGADAFILKPAEPEAFMAEIRAVLGGTVASRRNTSTARAADEKETLELYSATLIRKLEEKTAQLEEMNRALEQDIRERRTSESALQKANTKLRDQAALLDLAQDAIVVRDLDHHVLYWNRSAERLYGWSSEEAMGRSALDLVFAGRDAFDKAMQVVLEKGEWSGEIEQVMKNGQPKSVEARWTLVRDDEGNPTSVLAINTDITVRKQLEAQFLRAQRMESIGTLAGGIAHDFNNLLAPIVMGVSYLKRVETREKVLAVIENIEKSANRGTALVRQVLSFARGVEFSRVTTRVEDVIREVGAIVTSTFPKAISLRTAIPDGLWAVDGDATQLNQVLLNLCVNARDAMPDGGQLLITAENVTIDGKQDSLDGDVAPGRYVRIEVTDEGSGIAPEIEDRIVEPFFTTKKTGLGSGLGLSTALGIVRSHGGFIDLVTRVDEGSTFRIYLPVGTESEAGASPVTESHDVALGNDELILIVDDEPSILEIVQETLESYGYRTLVAQDGARAVELYAEHGADISLVITDMMMPRMDGAALIAALKRTDPEVTIIATSGLDGDAYDASGAMAFLKKPFSTEQLLHLLHSVLAESRT